MYFLFRDPMLDRAEKVELIISYLLQLTMVIAIFISFFKQEWLILFLTICVLLLTFLPALIRHNYRVHLPVELDLLTILFIFAALFLGEIQSFYRKIWWWDGVVHTASGVLFGLLGFLLVYILTEEKPQSVALKPGFVALFSFTFAVAIGAVWEIFEFIMDAFFPFNMMESGLVDTMWDLIIDAGGALFISTLGYFYIKRSDSLIFSRLIHRFVAMNPRLFRKRKFFKRIKERLKRQRIT